MKRVQWKGGTGGKRNVVWSQSIMYKEHSGNKHVCEIF